MSGHQYEHFTFPSSSALTSSTLKSHRFNDTPDAQGHVNGLKSRTLRGRPRSLSETSDTTIVPATFSKDAKSLKQPVLQATSESPLSFPPPHNDNVAKPSTASPSASASSDSQGSIQQASRTSSHAVKRTFTASEPQTLSPRALQTLLVSLQLLSLVPAIVGGIYCIYRALLPQTRPIPFQHGLVKTLQWNRRIEWLLCAMWAGLSGNYCHSMARGLTRRWLVYYPLPAAVIRLVSFDNALPFSPAAKICILRCLCKSSAGL